MNRKQKVAVVVGVVVIVLLVLVLATWVFRHEFFPLSDTDRAHFQAAVFHAEIRLYRIEQGRLPPDLQALAEPGTFTEEDYIEGIPNDPWGNPYELKILSDTEYRVLSRGEDGQENTEDDVVWPPEDNATGATHGAGRRSGPSLTEAQVSLVLVIALVAAVALTVAAVTVLKERKAICGPESPTT